MPTSVGARPPDVVFFLDRDLGRVHVAGGLRAIGYTVHTLASVYGNNSDQWVENSKWIPESAAKGWVMLTCDQGIRYTDFELALVESSKARVFCLSRGDLDGPTQAQYFVNNIHRIVAASAAAGPYIYKVYVRSIRPWWSPDID